MFTLFIVTSILSLSWFVVCNIVVLMLGHQGVSQYAKKYPNHFQIVFQIKFPNELHVRLERIGDLFGALELN